MTLHFQRSLASQLSPTDYSPTLISSAYPLNDTVGVRIPLQWSFSISLLPDTCEGDGSDDIMYSSSELPPWLNFDDSYLVFSGEAPTTSANITVTLSCSVGDQTISDEFQIVIVGQLSLPASLDAIVASPRNVIPVSLGPMKIDKAKLTQYQSESLIITSGPTAGWVTWNS